MPKDIQTAVVHFFKTAGYRAVSCLVILFVGLFVVRLIRSMVRRALLKTKLDSTATNCIDTACKTALWLLLLFILASAMHVPSAPLFTALGSVALAVGLALKDSLSNLANGVLLLGTKPFREGDFIDVDGISGTVRCLHLLSTELIAPDNRKILLPNGKITSACIINHSAHKIRRCEWKIPVPYGTDPQTVRSVLLALFEADKRCLPVPEPSVVLDEYGPSSVLFLARSYTATEDFWNVYREINEQIFPALARRGISMPFPKLDVLLQKEKTSTSPTKRFKKTDRRKKS